MLVCKFLDKQFNNLTDVKKYDYLLGMSMWMLTKERKDELLKQRDSKMAELKALRDKTPSDLWRDDLDAFMEKIDVVEEKERNEEMGIKKGSKAAQKATGGKKKIRLEETLPSPSAKRIAPKIGEELKKKITAAARIKEKRTNKVQVKKEKDADVSEDKDEFEMMLEDNKKTLKDKLGKYNFFYFLFAGIPC